MTVMYKHQTCARRFMYMIYVYKKKKQIRSLNTATKNKTFIT